jgi:hypothetical protein
VERFKEQQESFKEIKEILESLDHGIVLLKDDNLMYKNEEFQELIKQASEDLGRSLDMQNPHIAKFF